MLEQMKAILEFSIVLVYYPGYQIKVTNLANNQVSYADVIDTDSLISYKLSAGNYKVEVSYPGTKIQNIGKMYYRASYTLIILFYACDILYRNKKKEYLDIDLFNA